MSDISTTATLLVTRPQAQGHEARDALTKLGFTVDCQPLLNVTYHRIRKDISRYKGLIFTSAHAVRAFCESYRVRDIAVFTVGDVTASVAKEAGFKSVQSASGALNDLEELLTENALVGDFLYVRGQDISREIEGDSINEVIGYHTDLIEFIEEEVVRKLQEGHYSHVLFYSTRTAINFVTMMKKYDLSESLKRIKALCLAPSMVESLSVLPWQEIVTAKQPNQGSLFELLKD